MNATPPVTAPAAGTPAQAEVLIAEARAHARRRRRKTALIVIVIAAVIGGGFAGVYALTGSGPVAPSAPSRPGPLAAHAGRVTGYIDACAGLALTAAPHAAGTVTALRGHRTWVLVHGESNATYQTYRMVLPTAVAATAHVSVNQRFSFDLPPGRYVLTGRYDNGDGTTYLDVTIAAGRILHRDLPNLCK